LGISGIWGKSGSTVSRCSGFSNSTAGQDTDRGSSTHSGSKGESPVGNYNEKHETQAQKENEGNVYEQSVQTLRKVDNILDLYKFTEILGEGAFGKVYKAKSRKHGYKCAIKKIKKDHINKKESRKLALIHEMQVLENIANHHLVRTYELLHDDKNYYIVTELAKVDLFKFYSEREQLGLEPFSEK
jgi:serine/threonine protein kinase